MIIITNKITLLDVKSIIGILFLISSIVCHTNAQAIDSTGFYIIVDKNKRCASSFEYLHQKLSLCLSTKPFVDNADFEAVSEIHYDTLKLSKSITLRLSKKGFERLQILTEKLPYISLALVIDGIIIGSFENFGVISNPIPINSNLFANDIEWIYKKLKKQEHQK